jgi:hypothetical protein
MPIYHRVHRYALAQRRHWTVILSEDFLTHIQVNGYSEQYIGSS